MTQVAPASLSVMTARGLGSSCAVTGKDPSSFLAIHSCIGLAFDAERNGATVGFLRGKPQDRNQSLCQKRAPWAPLQLIQPNNKQQITALAFRQEQSPRGQARKRGAYSSRLPMQGHHLGSRAGSNFIMVDWNFLFFFPRALPPVSGHLEVLTWNAWDQLRKLPSLLIALLLRLFVYWFQPEIRFWVKNVTHNLKHRSGSITTQG